MMTNAKWALSGITVSHAAGRALAVDITQVLQTTTAFPVSLELKSQGEFGEQRHSKYRRAPKTELGEYYSTDNFACWLHCRALYV